MLTVLTIIGLYVSLSFLYKFCFYKSQKCYFKMVKNIVESTIQVSGHRGWGERPQAELAAHSTETCQKSEDEGWWQQMKSRRKYLINSLFKS